MTESKIRIGVVGVGFGSVVHIPAFQSEGLEVVAVCARREERARDAAERFAVPNAFTDYREMLALDGLDAVAVATPVSTHHPITMDALEASKHVLCEKPLAINAIQAREMWEKTEATGLTAMVAHEFRFASGRMRVKELIDEGYVGALHMALMSLAVGPRSGFRARPWSESDDAGKGGGFLGALGSHYIDCLRHWFGEVASVSGRLNTHFQDRTYADLEEFVEATSDDTYNFTLEFAQGGWANMIGTSAAAFGSGARVEIYGRDGTLTTPQPGAGFNPPPLGTILGAKPGDKELAELPIPARLEPFSDDRDGRMMPFRLLVREFVRGIREGVSPAPNLLDGLRCQEIMAAIRESSFTGSVVRFDERN
jgi:predicted dehydrogenase